MLAAEACGKGVIYYTTSDDRPVFSDTFRKALGYDACDLEHLRFMKDFIEALVHKAGPRGGVPGNGKGGLGKVNDERERKKVRVFLSQHTFSPVSNK